MSIVKTDCC